MKRTKIFIGATFAFTLFTNITLNAQNASITWGKKISLDATMFPLGTYGSSTNDFYSLFYKNNMMMQLKGIDVLHCKSEGKI